MSRIAMFVDWDNLRRTLERIQQTTGNIFVDFNNPSNLTKMFREFLNKQEEFYRIFFYTALHPTIEQIHDKLNASHKKKFEKFIDEHPAYRNKANLSEKFLKEIVKEDYVALRLGKLLVRGLKDNGYPILMQKQVDMLLGLDISHIAYNKLATQILIFSADTDVIPAIKIARVNGQIVSVANFQENPCAISDEIIKHSDTIRLKSLVNIANNIKSSITDQMI